MKFHKTIKYKLKNLFPMLTIAGMTLLPASCCKVNKDPVKNEPHHNTTYIWGDGNFSQIWPADKVAASADSVLVDWVILENDGNSFKGSSTTFIWHDISNVINCVKPENRHKIRGKGTLNNVGMSRSSEKNYQDSIALANLGFKFGHIQYVK